MKQLPRIALNEDGPVTRADLHPQEVWFLNICRKHPHCRFEEVVVVNGQVVSYKRVIERVEYEKFAGE